ncbi:hypothetical protein [Tsukamurella sp. NPDC003166]|uniref:hypothetical protein n=1 Tax=Tsukamurella sp. NPDC003166 TaxID=3154444 RepID=UPI0033A877D7
MIALVIVLLLAAAGAGVIVARRGTEGVAGVVAAAIPAVLVGAAARVAAVVAAMAGGSALVTAAFTLAGATGRDGPDPAPESGDTEGERSDGAPVPESPLRGGLAIGVLERAAIAVCVLANFAAGLAVIVAAKGLARYPELRNPGAAEQFIIGTFVSVLWATACAGTAVALGR